MGGGATAAAKGAAVEALPSAAASAPLSGPASGKAAAGAAGDCHHNGTLPGRLSQITGPEPGGQAASGSGSGLYGPPMPSPPRCSTVPTAPPPGQANGDDGTNVAACRNADNGDPLGNKDATAATVFGKAGDAGQVNNNHSSNNGDDNEDNNKWGRGALFNLSSSLLSWVVGHLISNAIATASLLLLGIAVPMIDVRHHGVLRLRRRRTLSRLRKR